MDPNLPMPIETARAKGPVFAQIPRLRAGSARGSTPGDADRRDRPYAAEPEAAARGTDVLPAGTAAIEDGLKPFAISQTAITIS